MFSILKKDAVSRRLYLLLLAYISTGILLSFFVSFTKIIENKYLEYRMGRIAIQLFQQNMNQSVIYFLFVGIISCSFLLLNKYLLKLPKKICLVIFDVTLFLFVVEYILRALTRFTLVSLFYRNFKNILAGKTTFHYILDSIVRYRVVIGLLLFFVIIFGFVSFLVKKNAERIIRFLSQHIMKYVLLPFLTLFIILNLSLFLYSHFHQPNSPNVVIFLIDSLKRDHLGVYGYERNTSPVIDMLAQEGIVYYNAISQCSWTSPSVSSLFTALYPSVHGVVHRGSKKSHCLDYRLITLAEVFKNEGYSTGAFVANPNIIPGLQYHQGFDEFFAEYLREPDLRAPELNERAYQWIASNRKTPFFTYIHYMDVHTPYRPPEPYDKIFQSEFTKSLEKEEFYSLKNGGKESTKNNIDFFIDQYDGEIRFTDFHIGKFLELLDKLRVLENTIIIVTSDHGEQFFEHGNHGHGWSLYGEEIRIPLVIRFPKSVANQINPQCRVGLIDLSKALMKMVGYGLPYGSHGEDLFNMGATFLKRNLFSEDLMPILKNVEEKGIKYEPNRIMINPKNLKAFFSLKSRHVYELYDLNHDSSERKNIEAKHSDLRLAIENYIRAWEKKRKQEKSLIGLREKSIDISDPDELNRLKALGYIK